MLEIIIISNRNQSVKILTRELVLEGDFSITKRRKLSDHGSELDRAIDGEDLSLATDVREKVIVRTGMDLTAIATHELDLVVVVLELSVVPWRRVFEIDLAGTRGGIAGFSVGIVSVIIHGGGN